MVPNRNEHGPLADLWHRRAVDEMKATGVEFLHDLRIEPWGQSAARFQSPEGAIIGLTYTPALRG